jgi:hypothetical protein
MQDIASVFEKLNSQADALYAAFNWGARGRREVLISPELEILKGPASRRGFFHAPLTVAFRS